MYGVTSKIKWRFLEMEPVIHEQMSTDSLKYCELKSVVCQCPRYIEREVKVQGYKLNYILGFDDKVTVHWL